MSIGIICRVNRDNKKFMLTECIGVYDKQNRVLLKILSKIITNFPCQNVRSVRNQFTSLTSLHWVP